MKKAALAGILSLSLVMGGYSFSGYTNEGKKHLSSEERAERHQEFKKQKMERLIENLNLSTTQQSQVKDIFESQGEKFAVIHEEMRKKKQALKAETDQKIEALLNADQKTKYETLKKEQESRREEWHKQK